jgi:hypothetical protein
MPVSLANPFWLYPCNSRIMRTDSPTIGDSQAHVLFPIMSPRLIVHLICEHIEPDLGA